jgi:hypothetical protein
MEVRRQPVISSGVTMLGPLPYLHRLLLLVAALLVGVGIGVWAGALPAIPLQVLPGALAGILLGLVGAWVLLHDFHPHPSARPARLRRRHR